MNGDDAIEAMFGNVSESIEFTTICRSCKRMYKQIRTEQTLGFRDMDFDICPYCGNINGRSMTYEFDNYPIGGM